MATLEEQVKELGERVLKLERHLGMAPLSGFISDFKKLMEGLDRRTLEVIFQGESEGSLACALMGQEKGVVESVKAALSKSRWRRVHATMKNLAVEGVTEGNVKSSQEALQRKVQQLEDMGNIVVAGDHDGELVGVPWDGKWEEKPKLDLREWTAKVLEAVAV